MLYIHTLRLTSSDWTLCFVYIHQVELKDPNMSSPDMQENDLLELSVVINAGKREERKSEICQDQSWKIPGGLNLVSDKRLRSQLQQKHQQCGKSQEQHPNIFMGHSGSLQVKSRHNVEYWRNNNYHELISLLMIEQARSGGFFHIFVIFNIGLASIFRNFKFFCKQISVSVRGGGFSSNV